MGQHSLDDLRRVIEKYWGFRTFRPLQDQAMQAVLAGRDSLVVLPTGGGKSLCYQAPAVLMGGTTVVVSPLIALMKDQVDGLLACGVSAVRLDSSLSGEERFINELEIREGKVRLLFVSPERLAMDEFCGFLQKVGVQRIAIDEAHCISHWGHDFRPEYRQLQRLKELFPQASVHGYTATATQRVRKDICHELGLKDPEVLVGSFDRPNLNYRILPKLDEEKQVMQVLGRHPKEAGIIYCIRRAEVDHLAARLKERGVNALPYHAGMRPEERKATQDAFAAEACDIIVATVAFGMGIDRSNIRFVLHTGMPKSIEHYQQETGRAGRDGLEAECALLYSMGDFMTWKRILEKSARENNTDAQHLGSLFQHLEEMNRYCAVPACRHQALVQYFGQDYAAPTCQACDVCLGDVENVADAPVVAQKILSCVARVQERFGVAHVVEVLRGADTEKIRNNKHEQLTTYGLLRENTAVQVRNWIYQLISQGLLTQEGGDRPVLKLNEASWQAMRKERPVRLMQPLQRGRDGRDGAVSSSVADRDSWEGVDRGLFEKLRDIRRNLAQSHSIPPYQVFGDATLRALARQRPSTLEKMRYVYGVGQKKLRDWGNTFLENIVAYCQEQQLATDQFGDERLPDARDEAARADSSAVESPVNARYEDYWEGVDVPLYEALCQERLRLALEQKVSPPSIVSEWAVRELARMRPSSLEQMRLVSGIGDRALAEAGPHFLDVVSRHCEQHRLTRDVAAPAQRIAPQPRLKALPGTPAFHALELFAKGASVDDVMEKTHKTRPTVIQYLTDFIVRERPQSIAAWVGDEEYQHVAQAARRVNTDRLKPIFIALDEKISYDVIRLVVSHLAVTSPKR